MNDDGSSHSPILGYAFDGNPIYGPYGYSNGVDDQDGVRRMESGYILRADRSQIIPSGGGRNVGSTPPSIVQFPMGSFVEDYYFDPEEVAGIEPTPPVKGGIIESEAELMITTEDGMILETDVFDPTVSNILLEDIYKAPLINSEAELFVVTENIPLWMGGPGITTSEVLLNDENSDNILTSGGRSDLQSLPIILNKEEDNGYYIETDVERIVCNEGSPEEPDPIPPWILGENNCRVCNTPEYPKELYPEGIYAYFITVDEDNVPAFPYIIGKTFCDRPISQVVNVMDSEGVEGNPTDNDLQFYCSRRNTTYIRLYSSRETQQSLFDTNS